MTNYLREATDTEVLAALPHVWEANSGRKYPANTRKVKLSLDFKRNEVTAFVYIEDKVTWHGHIIWNWDSEELTWFEIHNA